MSEPERRRRRAPISCVLCRSRKIRCDRGTPCNHCLRSRNGTSACVYGDIPTQSPRQHPTPRSSTSRASTLASRASARDVESMESRIRELEEQLSGTTQRPTQSPVQSLDLDLESTTPYLSETFSIYKTRMFGQSHWFNGVGLLRDLFEGIEPHIREMESTAFSGMQRCKSLAKLIKSQRAPPWPSLPRADLPPKDVADELVDCYLRTTETVHRVLHIPSFRRAYDALWVSDTEPDTEFLVQLRLMLAIGAITYDEHFSLRASAIHWVYEAQNWVSKPEFKSQLNIQSLQTNILLLLARETINVGGELVWISAGALFRTAVFMGLHRDPTHLSKRTPNFGAEMRRRLWNTILEICLQSSIISGCPPFVSLDDFDTKTPRNFDDDQLVAEDPVPKPENTFTQVSIAIALRKTFPLRLAITKYLNDLGSRCIYEETLRLDKDLRASYKKLRQTIQRFYPSTAPAPARFEIRVVDLLMNHYLSSLHIPYLERALHETAYAFSRTVVLETSLKICATTPSNRDDLARFTVCGSGFYRTVTFQASLMIAVELRTQMQEEESVGPVPLRPDLFSVLDDAKAWSLRCIEAGETNIKTYLLTSIVAAHIKGVMQGLGKDEIPELLIKATEEAEERCLSILEEKAAQRRSDGVVDGLDETSLNMPPGLLEQQDFMTSDALFNFGNGEPMSWLFNDGAMSF